MRLLIVIIMVLCLWVCTVPFSHTEPESVSKESAKTGTPVSAPSKALIQDSTEPDLAETLESIHAVTKSAQVAAKTIGRTLGQYVRQKYNEQQQREILARFNAALGMELASLPLTPAERTELTAKIEEAYIRDSETGANQLDQNYFHDLARVVKKEYSELRLAKTADGTVQTYDYDGNLKTKWTLQGGIPQGPVITYYSSGEIKFIDLYENGDRVSRKKYDEEGKLIFEQDYSYEKKAAPAAMKIEEPKKDDASLALKQETLAPQASEAAAAKAPESAVSALSAQASAPVPPKAAQPESDSFVVPVNYRREGDSHPAPASAPMNQAAVLKELNPEDGKIEVIFKETRTQSVQNETQNAGTAVSTQAKSLL